MTVSANALRELHRIHRQIADLRSRLAKGPKAIAAGQGSVNKLDQELQTAKDALTKARVACDDKQLQLKQREDRIVDLNNKLNTAASNKEYQAIKDQIAADQEANSVLSDEILEALEQLDVLQVDVDEASSNKKTAEDQLAEVKKKVESEQSGLESELARVTDELNTAESALSGDFKVEYERITKARGEDAIAEVQGECCGGCFQTLTPQTMTELMMSKPVFCKSCGCLLYLPETTTL